MWAHEPVLRYLIAEGVDPNGPYARDYGHYGPPMAAVCEVQNPAAMRLLVSLGARLEWETTDGRRYTPIAMLLSNYNRNPTGKYGCLAACEENGFPLPETPPMALHQGRLDRLERHLRQDPHLLSRRFAHEEIYPPALGIAPGEALTGPPLAGATLLHMAVEGDDPEMVRWFLDRGADPNARATPDAEGWGDHPPLFHTAITFGRRDDAMARLLVAAGADLSLRASVRRTLPDHEPSEIALRDVTAAEFARADWPVWLRNAAAAEFLAS
jgi:hypothetical protein